MLYCRRSMRLTAQEAASLLGMSLTLYEDLECGNVLMDQEQAKKLGQLYQSQARYFFEAAQQLDLLLASKAVIEVLKADHDRLQARVSELKDGFDRNEKENNSSS